MRNRWMLQAAIVALLFAGAQTRAGQPARSSPAPLRIGYVDLDRVAANSEMVRKRIDQVEADLRTKQKVYQAKAEELRRVRSELAQQESILTPAQVAQKKAQIKKLRDELDFLEYQANRTLKETSQQIIEPVLDQVLMAVERIAKAYKVDIVLRGDLVLFASQRVDLTDAVIRDLDRALKARNTKASPAKAPVRRSKAK